MFWNSLRKPILVLAPMADVTDAAFRRMIAAYGKPDVMWTEFVSADGLFLSPIGEYCEKFISDEISREELEQAVDNGIAGGDLLKDLRYSEAERPIVAQFFTSRPEMMRKAAILARKLGFDGIDINMGCPDKSVEKQKAGAALIKNPELAQEIIRAAKEGAEHVPVSVKTRIGYNKNELETWLPALLAAEPAVVTIHARTRKEMSLVPARWEHVRRAVEIRDSFGSSALIFGNGDVIDCADARKKTEETGADGVMLGRAIFGNPWLFAKVSHLRGGRHFEHPEKLEERSRIDVPTIPNRLTVMVEHTKLFEKLLPHKSFAIMKKHYKAYVNGWDGAKELRVKLMEALNATEVEMIISDYLKTLD